MRNRDVPMFIAICLLAVVLLIVAMILYNREVQLRSEVEALESELAGYSEQTHEGGAETAAPEIPESSHEYRFPIAPEDYRRLTSPFGYRVSPLLGIERYHNGVDIAGVWRAQVVAIADGVVMEHWPPPDGYYRGHDVYGGMVVIEHENGWRSVYAHLSETRVHTGWDVKAGEVIGRIGNTGKSDGAHLHLELRDATGRAMNPLLHFAPLEDER
ncbi:MAG: M23 family metallopeptidase [Rhodothermales bacterium]